jgi:hypothetical protein
MRLSSAWVEQTLSQFNAQVLPDDHPAVPDLSQIFGEHTFFLDNSGLNIVEPTGGADGGEIAARVLKVASWRDANKTGLKPHEPEPTEVVVALHADELNSEH